MRGYLKIKANTPSARFKNWTFPDITDDGSTKFGWRVFGDCFTLGEYTDIGCNTVILAQTCVIIEPHAQIGPNCSIISHDTISGKHGPVVLEEGAYIGANCVIFPNVTIGKNAIVGAGSVVTRSIPAGVIAWGTPARVVK